MYQGLPYNSYLTDSASGDVARAFAPGKSQIENFISQKASALPSGFAQQLRQDYAAQQARAYDQQQQGVLAANEQSKQGGAAGLLGQAQIANPTAYSGQAIQGNASIMNAPLATPGLGGLLGGLAGGLASAIPF